MFRKISILLGAWGVATGLGLAPSNTAPTPELKKTAIQQTNAASGKEMFTPCHGADGKGHGPAASAMKVAPTDLTQLAETHDGKYRRTP